MTSRVFTFVSIIVTIFSIYTALGADITEKKKKRFNTINCMHKEPVPVTLVYSRLERFAGKTHVVSFSDDSTYCFLLNVFFKFL